MKKRFNTPHRALAAATLLGVGFIHLHANAQAQTENPGIAEIFLEGKLTGPTCTLMAVPKTGGVVTGAANQKIDLGTGNLSAASNTTGIGTAIGSNWDVKTVLFSLTSDGNAPTVPPTNACNFASTGTVGWDIQLAAADPTLILTDGGKTYLKNAKPGTEGGTDAVVALKGGVGDTATIDLNLNSTGTYLSTGRADGLFSATANGNMSLSAQLVNGKATGKPTAGQYLTPIILAVQYK